MKQKKKKKETPEEFAERLNELEFKTTASAADPKRLTELICSRIHEFIRRLPSHRNPEQVPFVKGLYFFYESSEKSRHDIKGRIVRIGNHPRDPNGLKNRLWMHYSSSKNFSAFRKYVGGALLRKNDPNHPCLKPGPGKGHWEKQNEHACPKCLPMENAVNLLLKSKFTFRCVNIPEKSVRDDFEKKIIATIAKCPVCKPSGRWLGEKAYSEKVKESGLWNSSYVRRKEQMTFNDLNKLKKYVDQTIALYNKNEDPHNICLL